MKPRRDYLKNLGFPSSSFIDPASLAGKRLDAGGKQFRAIVIGTGDGAGKTAIAKAVAAQGAELVSIDKIPETRWPLCSDYVPPRPPADCSLVGDWTPKAVLFLNDEQLKDMNRTGALPPDVLAFHPDEAAAILQSKFDRMDPTPVRKPRRHNRKKKTKRNR